VAALSEDERVAEIARMLGGEAASAAARRHARELLAGRRKGRSV
jgi:DNA repair ATPase RecN